MPTTPTQMRLTESDRAKLESIRERAGLPSLSAAVRHSVDFAYTYWGSLAQGPPKKIRKKSGEGA